REAQQWVEQGLVQRDQAERILERFDTSLDDRRHWSLGYVVLVGLAILSLGLALFLLISHNWDEWPRAARMAGLVLVTLSSRRASALTSCSRSILLSDARWQRSSSERKGFFRRAL